MPAPSQPNRPCADVGAARLDEVRKEIAADQAAIEKEQAAETGVCAIATRAACGWSLRRVQSTSGISKRSRTRPSGWSVTCQCVKRACSV